MVASLRVIQTYGIAYFHVGLAQARGSNEFMQRGTDLVP
jgi:hypothetical protein